MSFHRYVWSLWAQCLKYLFIAESKVPSFCQKCSLLHTDLVIGLARFCGTWMLICLFWFIMWLMDPWAPHLSFVLVCASLWYVSLALFFSEELTHTFTTCFSTGHFLWLCMLGRWLSIYDHPSLNPPKRSHAFFLFIFHRSLAPVPFVSAVWGSGEQVEAEVWAVLGSVLAACAICCSPRGGQLVCWDVACQLGEAAGARPPAVGTAWLPGAWLSGWHHLARSRGAGGLSCVGRLAWNNQCQLTSPGAEYCEPAGQL